MTTPPLFRNEGKSQLQFLVDTIYLINAKELSLDHHPVHDLGIQLALVLLGLATTLKQNHINSSVCGFTAKK